MNGRVPHIIKPNKSGAVPQSWCVLATETLPVRLEEHRWQHVFRLGVLAEVRFARESKPEQIEIRTFTDSSELVSAVAAAPNRKERVGVIAHNMDYHAQVLDIHCRLREGGYRITKAQLERGKWVQRWQQGIGPNSSTRRTLLWLDLANFYPISLRELAKWLGLNLYWYPDMDASDEEWEAHCRNVVEVELAALRAWLEFCRERDLGYFASTIAGQAFNAFKHRFMKHAVYVHVHDDVIKLEQAAYIGGRAQEFYRGRAPRKPYVQLDVNSMFADVMYRGKFPVRQVAHLGPVTPSRLAELMRTQSAVAIVDISPTVPAFPVRVGPRVHYPIGRFRTVLPTPELRLAIEYDFLEAVHEVVLYDQVPLFRSYVQHFWRHRQRAKQRGDVYSSKLDKAFLVSLYGKFGQRIFTSELITLNADRRDEIWTEYDADDAAWYEYRSLAGRVERKVRKVYGRDTLIAIPAQVASYARVKLWRLMLLAGLDNVLYVDTDSLIVKREALGRLWDYLQSDALGGLRLVGESDSVYIRAPKWYRFGRKVRRARVSTKARAVGYDQFEQDEVRNMNWALSHDYACAAILEEVKINAPHRNLIPQFGAGHWLPTERAEDLELSHSL